MELKWSEEAMAAINTHLCLLQKGRRAAFLEGGGNEHDPGYHDDDDHGTNYSSSKRMRMTASDEGGGRFCSGDEDSISSREDNNAAAANIVDLASQLPLPLGWEQFLDLRSGQVYYIDWKSCRRSYDDPRKAFHDETASSPPQSTVIPNLRWELNYNKPSLEHELSDISSECISGTVCNDNMMGSITHQKHANATIKQEAGISIATSPLLDEDWDLMQSRGWLPLIGIDDDHSDISSASINHASVVAEKTETSAIKQEAEGFGDDDDDDANHLGENRELEVTHEEDEVNNDNDDVPYLLSPRNSSLCACAYCGFVYVRRHI